MKCEWDEMAAMLGYSRNFRLYLSYPRMEVNNAINCFQDFFLNSELLFIERISSGNLFHMKQVLQENALSFIKEMCGRNYRDNLANVTKLI